MKRSRLGFRARIAALLSLAALGPFGWLASDALERNNDFCTSCHLTEDVPLHFDIHRDLHHRPPKSLAAAHAAKIGETRPEDPVFRCIDCHGGVGFTGRARVKLLAARDTAVYLFGTFDEPDRMNHPLRDADCQKCHQQYTVRSEPWEPAAFHEVGVHNVGFDLRCVECHSAHDDAGRPDFHFLESQPLRARCALCHSEFDT